VPPSYLLFLVGFIFSTFFCTDFTAADFNAFLASFPSLFISKLDNASFAAIFAIFLAAVFPLSDLLTGSA